MLFSTRDYLLIYSEKRVKTIEKSAKSDKSGRKGRQKVAEK